MANVSIDKEGLEALINKLEQDNQDIIDILKATNDSIRSLDENIWESKEKKQLDSTLNPFLDSIDQNTPSYLGECTNNLRKALTAYKTTDQDLSKMVNDDTDIIN